MQCNLIPFKTVSDIIYYYHSFTIYKVHFSKGAIDNEGSNFKRRFRYQAKTSYYKHPEINGSGVEHTFS